MVYGLWIVKPIIPLHSEEMRSPPTSPNRKEWRAVPLTSQVGQVIKDRILSGELRPGERLVEQQIAGELRVGQNAVREALIDLAHRGFVRRITNRGTYVTKLTVDEAKKLAQVRAALESLAAREVAARVAAEGLDLQVLDGWLDRMSEAADAGDRQGFYDADLPFHQALWELAGNEYLSRMLEQIVVPLFALFIILYMRKDGARDSLREAVSAHRQLVAELRSGLPDRAARSIEELVNLSVKHQQGLISE